MTRHKIHLDDICFAALALMSPSIVLFVAAYHEELKAMIR